jgi:hypothetical protein
LNHILKPTAPDPAYIEFLIGDYQHELGIIDKKYKPKAATNGAGGAVIFANVEDVAATLETLKAMRAEEYERLINCESGFITASVIDPFGNILELCTIHITSKYLERIIINNQGDFFLVNT